MYVCVCIYIYEFAPKLRPRCAQLAPRMPSMCPACAKDGPRIRPRVPRMCPACAQDSPRMRPGPRMRPACTVYNN